MTLTYCVVIAIAAIGADDPLLACKASSVGVGTMASLIARLIARSSVHRSSVSRIVPRKRLERHSACLPRQNTTQRRKRRSSQLDVPRGRLQGRRRPPVLRRSPVEFPDRDSTAIAMTEPAVRCICRFRRERQLRLGFTCSVIAVEGLIAYLRFTIFSLN